MERVWTSTMLAVSEKSADMSGMAGIIKLAQYRFFVNKEPYI